MNISRTTISCALLAFILSTFTPVTLKAQDKSSSTSQKPVPKLTAVVCVGEKTGEPAELTQNRGEKPTIIMFIQLEKWDRPIARLLRELDQQTNAKLTDGSVVAVWLSNNEVAKLKEHLPRVQQSLKLSTTTYAAWSGDTFGPSDWNLNQDESVTVITINKGMVLGRHTFRSTNEGDAAKIMKDFGIQSN